MISTIVNEIFELYWWLIILQIFLTWIPSINWYNQPFKTLKMLVEPFLNIFSNVIPSISGIDISPIFAIVILKSVQRWINQILVYFNL